MNTNRFKQYIAQRETNQRQVELLEINQKIRNEKFEAESNNYINKEKKRIRQEIEQQNNKIKNQSRLTIFKKIG